MRSSAAGLTLVTALLVSSCGGATAVVPTAPSPAAPTTGNPSPPATIPSLIGAWRGRVRSSAVRAGSDTSVGFGLNCSQRWEISSQSGRHFEGSMGSQGGGPDSDWRCTSSRPFAGELTSDGRVTVEFIPHFRPGGCTNVVGGERATGSMSGDSIILSIPYRATCEMSLGGGAPWWDLDIAATLTLTPW